MPLRPMSRSPARDTGRVSDDARDRRRLPDAVWLAWLLAAAVLVVLLVNVVRHLSAPPGAQHMHAGEALFRAGAAPLGPLLSHRLFTAWHVDAVALAFLVLLGAWYATALARRRRRRAGAARGGPPARAGSRRGPPVHGAAHRANRAGARRLAADRAARRTRLLYGRDRRQPPHRADG